MIRPYTHKYLGDCNVPIADNPCDLTLQELLTSVEASEDEESDCLYFFVQTAQKSKIIPALENYVNRVERKFLGYHYLLHLSHQLESEAVFRHRVSTAEERDSIFGQGTLQQYLFERILDGDEQAMTIAVLEAIDKGEFKSAAQLACDVKHWDDLLEGELDNFQLSHSPDSALLCLLGKRLGDIPFWSFDLEDMIVVVQRQHHHIMEFFELL